MFNFSHRVSHVQKSFQHSCVEFCGHPLGWRGRKQSSSVVFTSESGGDQELPPHGGVSLLKRNEHSHPCSEPRAGPLSPLASPLMFPHWLPSLISYRWKVLWLKLPTLLLSSSSAPACFPPVPRNWGPCVPWVHMPMSRFPLNLPSVQDQPGPPAHVCLPPPDL